VRTAPRARPPLRRPKGSCRWIAAALVLPMLAARAGDLAIIETPSPSQLAFPPAEVDAHSESTWQRKIEAERAAGTLGCRTQCERIEAILDRLIAAAARIADGPPMHWQLAVGRNPNDEAWALPGGRLYVSEAFVESEGLDDDELAFVLGHEMGHALLQHENAALTVASTLVPRGLRRSVANLYAELDFNLGLALRLQPEWQAAELEADRVGMLLGGAAGFDPDGMLRYLGREAARGDVQMPVIATHPQAQLRYARAQAYRSSAQVLRERYAGQREGPIHRGMESYGR